MTSDEYRQLVDFLGRQFAAIDQRFVAIDQRFVAIDQRFVGIDQRFDHLERRIEEGFREILGHLDAIYGRLERLEQEYQAILEALRRIEAGLADERVKREALERGLAELKERVALLQARIDDVERRLRS
jgi:predicted  nucleic acid-binding Zn-ribbon protein